MCTESLTMLYNTEKLFSGLLPTLNHIKIQIQMPKNKQAIIKIVTGLDFKIASLSTYNYGYNQNF